MPWAFTEEATGWAERAHLVRTGSEPTSCSHQLSALTDGAHQSQALLHFSEPGLAQTRCAEITSKGSCRHVSHYAEVQTKA